MVYRTEMLIDITHVLHFLCTIWYFPHKAQDGDVWTQHDGCLLESNNLLKHHTTDIPQIRGFGSGGYWFHETAVIKEAKTNKQFAVDSWWKDNGKEPYIIPLEQWHEGWRADEE